MEKENSAVNTTQPAAPEEKVIASAPEAEVDAEARIAELESEKARLIEEGANWKVAALKYKKERKSAETFEEEGEETDEERLRRITREEIANSRIAQIDSEKDLIIKKSLQQIKELKLAVSNKNIAPPVSTGTHSESTPVRDTLVTPEQMAAFKARGWSEKEIERYKKNLNKYGGR